MSSHDSDDKSHAPTGRVASGPFHHVRLLPERKAHVGVGRLVRLALFALLLLAVGFLYRFACASPALFVHGQGGEGFGSFASHTYSGLECLRIGWLIPQHWIANIFLLVGLICLGTGRSCRALVLGILAVSAAASMILVSEPDDLRSGYYLWVASMCSFALGSLLFFLADWYRARTKAVRKERISATPKAACEVPNSVSPGRPGTTAPPARARSSTDIKSVVTRPLTCIAARDRSQSFQVTTGAATAWTFLCAVGTHGLLRRGPPDRGPGVHAAFTVRDLRLLAQMN